MLRWVDAKQPQVTQLFHRFGLGIHRVASQVEIPGSFWGEEEAGLIGSTLYVHDDTPIHSVLHESSHFICMPKTQRKSLHTDAGGSYSEENAACYLQILLSDHVDSMGRESMFIDMDAWGYSFRLGSAKAWFYHDSVDVFAWLLRQGILCNRGQILWQVRVTG